MERDIFATALRVLEQVARSAEPVGVRELSRTLTMTVGSTHRALQLLKRERFVVQLGERGLYRSGGRIFELAAHLVKSHDLVPAAVTFLRKTAEAGDESVVLMVADAYEAACVASVESGHLLRTVFPVGWRGPLYWGASGRLLLAFQPEETVRAVIRAGLKSAAPTRLTDPEQLVAGLGAIRKSGDAVSHGEREHGLSSVAAAVRDPQDMVIAAVAMYGPSARFSRSKLPGYLDLVRTCAGSISEALAERQAARAHTLAPRIMANAVAPARKGARNGNSHPSSERSR